MNACRLLVVAALLVPALAAAAEPLAGTAPLTLEGDLAAQMVAGADKLLLRELARSPQRREALWPTLVRGNAEELAPLRQRLARRLGVRDERLPFAAPELVGTTERPAVIGRGAGYEIVAVRWPVFRDVQAEGLLLRPTAGPPRASVVALPDADQSPEQLCGLAAGVPAESQFARRLAEAGCRVLIPALVSREIRPRAPPGRAGGAKLTDREFVYRPAFELGRHVIGYEVQRALAGVDWLLRDRGAAAGAKGTGAKVAIAGYGEGGRLALYAAALEPRIDAALASGCFGPREGSWQEPLDRNVFGLLQEFGDAELALLIAPRPLILETGRYPELTLAGEGGAPGALAHPGAEAIARETARLQAAWNDRPPFWRVVGGEQRPPTFGSADALAPLLQALGGALPSGSADALPEAVGPPLDAAARQQRLVHGLERDTQWLLRESPFVRDAHFKKLYDCRDLPQYAEVVEEYRREFAEQVIGRLDLPLLPARPRSRQTLDTPQWTGYEVVLDVFPDVFAYGVLLVPKGIPAGEKRPVVVCQHGLEGRPMDTIAGDHRAYHDYAARLCERGFVTFAPQNLYIGKDAFRTLQRKANPLGLSLFSIIVPQHQQLCDWLQTLPFVDGERIAFYGLSYGGKSAMRIPALVPDYCLSICSADFNEWVAKNASTRLPFSYVWTGEYEIFEFDLGSTFNYAEMAALICPRPFMVERGHTDGVSTDDWVAHEFARAYFHYSHRLKIGERCVLEVFDGPHTIHGQGTFAFLHQHLRWPAPQR